MAEVETDIYEAYAKAKEAWDAVPKMPMKVEFQGDYVIYSCPTCGVVFAQVYNDGSSFRFDQPIFCCGNVLV